MKLKMFQIDTLDNSYENPCCQLNSFYVVGNKYANCFPLTVFIGMVGYFEWSKWSQWLEWSLKSGNQGIRVSWDDKRGQVGFGGQGVQSGQGGQHGKEASSPQNDLHGSNHLIIKKNLDVRPATY